METSITVCLHLSIFLKQVSFSLFLLPYLLLKVWYNQIMLVISEEFIAIEEAVDQLVADLKEMPQYKAYAEAKAAVEADMSLQVEMRKFQNIKQSYAASETLQAYRPEVRQLRREMLAQKRSLDCHPLVVAMRLAQVDFQVILANISEEIAGAVSESIFVDTGLPLASKRPRHSSGPYQNIKEKGL